MSFHIGQRVKLTAVGIQALGHVLSKSGKHNIRYDEKLRATVVNPKGKHGSLEVRRDGIRRVDGFAHEFWQDADSE